MNEEARRDMRQYLDDRLNACKEQEKALMQDQRSDEATLSRIEGNIYEVFRTVWDVACKQQEDAAALSFFRSRLTQIPQNWQKARDAALVHGDTEKAHIESVKLTAAQCISDALAEIWGDAK